MKPFVFIASFQVSCHVYFWYNICFIMNNVMHNLLICIRYFSFGFNMKIFRQLSKMTYIIKRGILFSITIAALYSCTSLGKIAIQVAVPPKNPISPEIQSIAILNRSMTANFINLKPDSIEKRLVANNRSFKKTFFDSIAADTAIQVAAREIFASQRFDVVIPLERNVWRDDKGSGILEPLDTASINELCKDFKVDGVLVLESFSEMVTRFIRVLPANDRAVYKGIIDLTYKSTWRFYQPRQNPPYLSFPVSGSIFWESSGYCYTLKEMYKKLPTTKEALIGGALASAMDIVDSITPKWVDETRYYYITKNENIDAAIPLIKMNKWVEAAEIWLKYSSESDKSLRSMVEYNLALASEMTGDIDQAIEWGVKSLKTKYSGNTERYLKDLQRRRSALMGVKM